jgi:hypothetical protein
VSEKKVHFKIPFVTLLHIGLIFFTSNPSGLLDGIETLKPVVSDVEPSAI